MEHLIKLLMKRDKQTREEVENELQFFKLCNMQGDFFPCEAEEEFCQSFDLEPDFFEILLFDTI